MKNSSPNPKKEPEEVSSYGRYTPTTALWAAGKNAYSANSFKKSHLRCSGTKINSRFQRC
jgi:hypothetical protein